MIFGTLIPRKFDINILQICPCQMYPLYLGKSKKVIFTLAKPCISPELHIETLPNFVCMFSHACRWLSPSLASLQYVVTLLCQVCQI